MRIEKLKLHNFRQFIDTQVIEFATEKDKNITGSQWGTTITAS